MGLKKNFIFSTVLTVSNYIFPFIVYPYVSRVLGVNNIGICNFVDSIINYTSLFAMMGLAIVGIREVAKTKGHRSELDATFTSLMVLCSIFTLTATVVLVGATFLLEALQPYRKLLLIGLVKLWGNFLLIDWLYKGLEDFKYITMRTIAVKLGYIAFVFIFVHSASDYVIYFLLLCLMVSVNSAINCFHAIKIVRLRFDWPLTRRLAKPYVTLGAYMILNSMYTTFNVIYLGLEWGDTEVGYYTTSTKLFSIIMAIYTAYSSVVMPRASALLSNNKISEFRAMIQKSIQGLMMMAVPISVFTMLYSPGIVYLIGGPQYGGAIPSMTIVMPLVFIIGYEQILVMQTLTPLASDRVVLFNSVMGASVGVLGNLLLVGRLASVGSAIVWVSAEIVVLTCAQYFVKRRIGLTFPARDLAFNLFAYAPFVLISYFVVNYLQINDIQKMLVGAAICGVYFMLIQHYVLKNPLYLEYVGKMTAKIHKYVKQ